MEGEVSLSLDQKKIDKEAQWDGLKGYLTNAQMDNEAELENYGHLWQIEKACRVAKSELRIRPVFHYKQRRIEAHICLNFAAYKVYKKLERKLKEKGSALSPGKIIEITVITPKNEAITQTILITEEQQELQALFDF